MVLGLAQALGGARVLRHLADDAVELGDGLLVVAALQGLEAAVQGRPERLRPREQLLHPLDPRRGVPVDALERGERGVILDDEHGLVGPWAAQPGRERLAQLVQAAQPGLDVAANSLRVLAELAAHLHELRPHLSERGKAPRRILLQRPLEDRAQLRRQGRVHLGERRRIVRAEVLEDLDRVVAREGRPVRQELVEDRADREDVRVMATLPTRPLGRHVLQRAHDEPRAREPGLGRRDVGDAEVEDLHLPVPEHEDVGGLHVAVDDALLVRELQPVADLDHERELVLDAGERLLGDELPKLVALEQLHHDEEVAVRFTEIVNGHDVGMAQLGAGLSLAKEPGAELVGVIGLGGDDLQRDQPIQHRVVRLVDAPHAAAADALEDPVLPDQLVHHSYRRRIALMLSRPPRALALSTS